MQKWQQLLRHRLPQLTRPLSEFLTDLSARVLTDHCTGNGTGNGTGTGCTVFNIIKYQVYFSWTSLGRGALCGF